MCTHTILIKIIDMGSSKWQAESFFNWSHKQRSWTRSLTKASLPIFLWGGSPNKMLGSGI